MTKIRVSSNGILQTFTGPDLVYEVLADGRLKVWDLEENALQALFQADAWEWIVLERDEGEK
jgi:hypothetical protein